MQLTDFQLDQIYEPTGNWLVDATGKLRMQLPEDKDRCLSHTARERAERYCHWGLIQLLTGYDRAQQTMLRNRKLFDFLLIAVSDKIDDIMHIAADSTIQSWWRDEWYRRDMVWKELLLKNSKIHRRNYSVIGYSPTEAQQRATHNMRTHYYALHSRTLDANSDEYKQLENSYCKMWSDYGK